MAVNTGARPVPTESRKNQPDLDLIYTYIYIVTYIYILIFIQFIFYFLKFTWERKRLLGGKMATCTAMGCTCTFQLVQTRQLFTAVQLVEISGN